MNDLELQSELISYNTAAASAARTLSELKGIEIDQAAVQSALCASLEISELDSVKLVALRLDSERIMYILRDYDFQLLSRPEIVCEIELMDSIIPPQTPRLLIEQTVKVKGEVWTVHKNDADPWPSNPHAHNYEAGLTLHLGTGELFNKQRICVGNIGSKRLSSVRGKLRDIDLPTLVS